MSHQPDDIAAATQVVSLVEVRGTNKSLVPPRGAVGIVNDLSDTNPVRGEAPRPAAPGAEAAQGQADVIHQVKIIRKGKRGRGAPSYGIQPAVDAGPNGSWPAIAHADMR